MDNFCILLTGTKNFIGPNSSSSYRSFQYDHSPPGGQQRTATHMLFLSGLNLSNSYIAIDIFSPMLPNIFSITSFIFKVNIWPCPCLFSPLVIFQGVKEFSVPVGLDAKVKVDLVVVGSVAVSEKGEALPTRHHHLTTPALLNIGILEILQIITIIHYLMHDHICMYFWSFVMFYNNYNYNSTLAVWGSRGQLFQKYNKVYHIKSNITS